MKIVLSKKSNQNPIHDDNKISFGFNKRDGRWNCFAGCGSGDPIDFYAVRMDITRQDAIKVLSDELRISLKKELVAEYFYRNGSGKTIYKKERYEPKEFLFKSKTKTGWELGLNDSSRVPYNLNKILKSKAVIKTLGWVTFQPVRAQSETINMLI